MIVRSLVVIWTYVGYRLSCAYMMPLVTLHICLRFAFLPRTCCIVQELSVNRLCLTSFK